MSTESKRLRAQMRGKAERLANMKDCKVDSSDWSPAELLNADIKTGARPTGRQGFKSGGKVEDAMARARADSLPRTLAKPKKDYGPESSLPGGRAARKSGGRTKGKSNINIIINAGKSAPEVPAGGVGPVKPPMPPMPPPGLGMPAGGPPMGAGGPPPGMPMPPPDMVQKLPPSMLGRKSGGRVRSYKDMDAGAGSGEGRLEKTEIQRSKHAGGGRTKSYKDMTAGAGSGEGRLEKTEIEKSQH